MNPHRKTRSSPASQAGLSKPVQGGLSAAALVLIPVLAIGGSDSFRAALDFTTGVLSLVSLTASVAWGLIATDRLLLSTRHRLLAQAIHRTTAVASLGFLLLHATVKVSLGHVALIGALIPFGLGVTGTSGLIGFGSLAGLLMVIAASTGAARSALAGRGSIAARWRPLHMLAYPAWCCALVHGLYAGRPAATWVTTMYCLALAGVAAAVSIRLLPRPAQQRLAERVLALIGPGTDKPGRGRGRRRDPSVSPLPGASGIAPPRLYDPPFEQELRREPVTRPERPAASPDLPLGRPREQPRTLTPPSPPLYEPGFPSPSTSGTTGAGISAAYRAVSLGNAAAGSPTGSPTQEIPYAERVPMTEELPVMTDEPATRPGYWPTPSPPPPAPSPAPASYGHDTTPPPYSSTSPTEPAPGPFQQPPAGEPWTAPAGDRP
ncbi:ferric reductase-like transmembrane domain-containing protein [Streptomyces sp. CB03234]|uniref:ferric reductase-like transmembrane domain-containing protein n=1 Tax=Streptomyces sp. (strain CB03234) TaxID=1703937 RepID=UPI00093B7D3B|nr:ferric reductase-like transmembrane domain-containing protein [Streptomyces sp. CB03234]